MAMRPRSSKCEWYHVAAVKAEQPVYVPNNGGTTVIFTKGSRSDVEVGDHAYVSDDKEKVAHWFVIDAVDETSARGWIPASPNTLLTKPHVTVVTTPGKKPSSGLSARAKGTPP